MKWDLELILNQYSSLEYKLSVNTEVCCEKPQSPSKLFSAPSHQQPTLVKPRDCPGPIQQQISVLSLYQHVLIF